MQEPLLHNHHDWVHYDSSGHNYSMHHGVNSPTSFWSRWFQSPQQKKKKRWILHPSKKNGPLGVKKIPFGGVEKRENLEVEM